MRLATNLTASRPSLPRLLALALYACLSLGLAAPTALALGDKEDWATVEDINAPPPARETAARAICTRAKAAGKCDDAAGKLLEIAMKATTPPELGRRIADAVGGCGDEKTGKLVAAGMLKGQTDERLLHVRAARNLKTPAVADAALKMLADKEPRLRGEALEIIVAHKIEAATPKLEEIVAKGKDLDLLGPAVRGVSELLKGGPRWADWEAKLVGFGNSPVDELRRSALAVLSSNKDATRFDYWLALLDHADWSTRSIAAGWIERAKTKRAIGALIDRLAKEQPGTRVFADIDDALGRMTAMGRWETAEEWATWWKNTEAAFEFPKNSGAVGTKPKEEESALGTGGVHAKFYGIEVETKRAIFVIDISGSMNEATQNPDYGGRARIEVAKDELIKLVDELPQGSWFNIVTFSTGVEQWLEGLTEASGEKPGKKPKKGPATGAGAGDKPKDEKEAKKDEEKQKKHDAELREKAKDYVSRLGANGATNIFDALELAFEDPDVDTIFFLTDGEPTAGKEVEPTAIREAVKRWNSGRGVRIHTVAVGQNFPLLQGISQDNGGEHRFIE